MSRKLEHAAILFIRDSSKGRTTDFESVYGGSNPSSRTNVYLRSGSTTDSANGFYPLGWGFESLPDRQLWKGV